ncbi:hypothetical protein CLV30_106128 [Haloactinopolyspora alba]|uniref:Terminase small subunit n=1 Tax=Haloactinopolyspora alba TaxID=648780 RepID=A0A2P8E3S8_9ACTN|nr:hypothetical protein [Haloactinopolyspora alba]PSL04123.1 hypothetical protein CLV30_106128 [Haloactinopolyspora alba]
MPGPTPKRSEERRRRNQPEGVQVTKGEAMPVTWDIEPDVNWHPIALRLYESAATSGQSRYYQDTDWALLYSLCDDLSHYKNSRVRSGQMLQSIMTALQNLMLTEGDRRRLRLELAEPEAPTELASVTAINDARAALGVGE